MKNTTKCTSDECPMKHECFRSCVKYESDSLYNFEYECNENTGFCDFIYKKEKP